MRFSHLDEHGHAIMVDVGDKPVSARRAVAAGKIYMSRACFQAVTAGEVKKGDVLGVARVAGIMATKRTAELIPLCHPLLLSDSSLEFVISAPEAAIEARCEVSCQGRTGVEMEALTGASVALLTIYDMCKALDKSLRLSDIRLLEKSGGQSGDYRAK